MAVNGETVRSPEQKVAFGTDRVEVDGVLVGYVEKEYYMLNKPAGVVSATEDARHKTVLDLISSRQRRGSVSGGPSGYGHRGPSADYQ